MEMIEFIMRLNIRFTDEEKDACLPTVVKMGELAEKARREGLLAFEALADSEDDVFFKRVLSMMVDGLDKVSITMAMQAHILSDDLGGTKLLSRLIIAMGCICILCGDNPRIIMDFLLSMLGDKYLLRKDEIFGEVHKKGQIIKDFREKLEANMPETVDARFEALILCMHDYQIQYLLREVPISGDCYLALALRGVGNRDVWQKIFRNISENRQLDTISDFAIIGAVRTQDIQFAQGKFIDTVERLLNQGEIWLPEWNTVVGDANE